LASEFRKMIRILNTTVDGDRTIYAALASIKGIGFSLANAVLKKAGIDRYKRAGELTDEEISKIEEAGGNQLCLHGSSTDKGIPWTERTTY